MTASTGAGLILSRSRASASNRWMLPLRGSIPPTARNRNRSVGPDPGPKLGPPARRDRREARDVDTVVHDLRVDAELRAQQVRARPR